MGTLLGILDFIVLLLLVVHVPRVVWAGSRSMILTIFIGLAAIIFGIVSLSAFLGLVGVLSSSMRVLLLVVLLIMATLVGLSLPGDSAA